MLDPPVCRAWYRFGFLTPFGRTSATVFASDLWVICPGLWVLTHLLVSSSFYLSVLSCEEIISARFQVLLINNYFNSCNFAVFMAGGELRGPSCSAILPHCEEGGCMFCFSHRESLSAYFLFSSYHLLYFIYILYCLLLQIVHKISVSAPKFLRMLTGFLLFVYWISFICKKELALKSQNCGIGKSHFSSALFPNNTVVVAKSYWEFMSWLSSSRAKLKF